MGMPYSYVSEGRELASKVETYQVPSDEVLVIKVAVSLLIPGKDIEILGQCDENAEEETDV